MIFISVCRVASSSWLIEMERLLRCQLCCHWLHQRFDNLLSNLGCSQWQQSWHHNNLFDCSAWYYDTVYKCKLFYHVSEGGVLHGVYNCNNSTTLSWITCCLTCLVLYIYIALKRKKCRLRENTMHTGPCLNIKTVLSTYGDFHVKDKTAARTSYL